MLTEYRLDIKAGLEYAKKWAYSRNPAFTDFELLGGDCTNFVSQCIFAEGAAMNYTRDTGWYYISPDNRAAAWTGVEWFYRFIVSNSGAGPFGREIPVREAVPGDVIQLCTDIGGCYHSLFVISVSGREIFIAAHTNDAYGRPLSSYGAVRSRALHIVGARRYI